MKRTVLRVTGACALLGALLALLATGAWWWMQRQLPAWQPQLAEWIAEAVGAPVAIDSIAVDWGPLGPRLSIVDLQVEIAGIVATIDKTTLQIGFWQLLRERQVRVQDIRLSGVELSVDQDLRDLWPQLLGMVPSWDVEGTAGLIGLADDFRLVIAPGRIHYRPSAEAVYELQDLSVELVRRERRWNVEINTDLPAALGDELQIVAAAVLPRTADATQQAREIVWSAAAQGRSAGEEWYVNAASEPAGGQFLELGIERLTFAELVPWLNWLPAGEWRERMLRMDLTGTVRDLRVELRRTADGAIVPVLAQGLLQDGGWQADGWLPGVRGVSGAFRIEADRGELALASDVLTVDYREQYAQPLRFADVRGLLMLSHDAEGWRISGDDLHLRHDALQADGHFVLQLPPQGSPRLDLQLDAPYATLPGALALVPSGLFPQGTDWLGVMFPAGILRNAKVRVDGDLAQFPFADGGGEFSVEAAFDGTTLVYSPDWPAIYGGRGLVRFVGWGLSADVTGGQIVGSTIVGGSMQIADLRDPWLQLEGSVASNASRLIGFLQDSPLRGYLGPLVDSVRGSGPAVLDLQLGIAVLDTRRLNWVADIRMQGVNLGYGDLAPEIERLRGVLHLDNGRVSAQAMTGRLQGESFTASVASGTQPQDPLRIQAQGTISAATLERWVPLLAGTGIAGVTSWQATLAVPSVSSMAQGSPMNLTLTSDLHNLHLPLPEPLHHLAYERTPLILELELSETRLQNFTGQWGDALSWSLRSATGTDGRSRLDGHVHLGGSPPIYTGQPGITVTGHVPSLDIDAWLAWLGSSLGSLTTPGAGTGTMLGLRSLTLQTDLTRGFGQEIRNLSVALLPTSGGGWTVQLNSPTVAGVVRLPADSAADRAWRVDLQRLILGGEQWAVLAGPRPVTAASALNSLSVDPRKLPPLQITIGDFGIGEMRFGRVELTAQSTSQGLEITRVFTSAGHFTIQGQARWVVDPQHPEQALTALTLQLRSTDAAKTLRSLGYDVRIDAKDVMIDIDLGWNGAPYANSWRETLHGDMHVRVGEGWLGDIDPGAGRVLGLMSLAMLPRRLALDFRDVFGEGMVFDSITGDFLLVAGQAYTDNLQLRGPAGGVTLVGRAGLATRDYQQQALVTANVGMTLLPWLGGLFGGAGTGAIIMFFQELFRAPLRDISSATYCISGAWETPELRRLTAAELEAGRLCAEFPRPLPTQQAMLAR